MKFPPNNILIGRTGLPVVACACSFVISLTMIHAEDKNEKTTDRISKPELMQVVPKAPPRSWGRAELFDAENAVETGVLEVARLMAEDRLQTSGPVRSGVCQEFALVDSSINGKWIELEDGGWLWTMSFTAAGAKSVRLHLTEFKPPAGAELIVYAPDDPDSVRGPIILSHSPLSDLWTPTIHGSPEIRVEYYLPAEFRPDDPNVHIFFDSLLNNYMGEVAQGGGPEGTVLPCHLDVSCYPDWNLEARGVGALSFVSGPFGFFCSGAMLGRIGDDFTPLLMTASHCGLNGPNASSLLVTWHYRTNSCNGTVPALNTLPQTQGVVLLRNHILSDYTLVGLSSANTGGVSYLGWNSSSSWSEGSPTVAIHHPEGSWQRICFGSQDDTFVSCIDGAADGWHVVTANGNGLTQPGSSGSPVFDSNRRVRGTQSCGTFACNSANGQTYGRFNLAFPILAPWLNPTDPIYLDAGYNGGENGTAGQPFNTVLEGTYAVLAGSTMFLDPGVYDGPALTIDKPVTLRAVGGGPVTIR